MCTVASCVSDIQGIIYFEKLSSTFGKQPLTDENQPKIIFSN